jgi:hypothetical protein
MPPQPPQPTRLQAIQILHTIESELLRVYSDLSRCSDGRPLHHDTLYQSTYRAANTTDHLVAKACALAPLLLSLKQRFELQVRHYRAWRMLVAAGLATEEAICLTIDQSSPVNKAVVMNLLERLAAFPGFAPVDISEAKYFECRCLTCERRAGRQERGDLFVQPGYWFVAVVVRSGCDGEEVLERLKRWGGFGDWDEAHTCYVPDERLNEEGVYVESVEEEGDKYGLDGGSIGVLFGEDMEDEEAEEEEKEDDVENIDDIALQQHTTTIDEEARSTDIQIPAPPPEQPINPILTLSPASIPTDPCPEHCPSRCRRLRDNIRNPYHTSCRYHCHTPHSPFEFEQSGEQVGFWLPHGLRDARAREEWAGVTIKRMERFEKAWKGLFGDDGEGRSLAAEVECCVWEFLKTGDGVDEGVGG